MNTADYDRQVGLKTLQSEIANNSEVAFTNLYSLLAKRLIAFSASIIHSKEIAEEVVEDTFVKLWLNRNNIEAIENLPVYLYVAVKNQSLNKISEKARQLITQPFDTIETEVELISEDPCSILITAEMLSKINAAIDALPSRCKIIFKLVREDGLKYKEVSQILNVSVNTIDAQMAIAVKRICEALGVTKSSSAKRFNLVPKKS